MRLTLLMIAAVHCLARALLAQADLLVTNSPNAPADAAEKAGTAFAREIACFRCAASNGSVEVTAFQLTPSGTGDWVNDLDPTNGVEVWRDDGDGAFSATLDTRLSFGPGSASPFAATFSPTAVIPDATFADFWVVLNVLPSAGTSVPTSFVASLASPSDIVTGAGVNISLGSPSPVGASFSVVIFFVSLVSPDVAYTGASIWFFGSGFTLPITVTIGGVVCPGVPSVFSMGTELLGLLVPSPASSSDPGPHTIVITSGTLPPQTLTQTFLYQGSGGEPGPEESCSTSEAHNWNLLAILSGVLSLIGLSRIVRWWSFRTSLSGPS